MSSKKIDNVHFLKVDTEGHDLMVLQGFPWEVCLPCVILCEFDDAKTGQLGYQWMDLAAYLVDKKYKLLISEWEPITEYGRPSRWSGYHHYPDRLWDESAWGNLLAAADNSIYEALLAELQSRYARRESFRWLDRVLP